MIESKTKCSYFIFKMALVLLCIYLVISGFDLLFKLALIFCSLIFLKTLSTRIAVTDDEIIQYYKIILINKQFVLRNIRFADIKGIAFGDKLNYLSFNYLHNNKIQKYMIKNDYKNYFLIIEDIVNRLDEELFDDQDNKIPKKKELLKSIRKYDNKFQIVGDLFPIIFAVLIFIFTVMGIIEYIRL